LIADQLALVQERLIPCEKHYVDLNNAIIMSSLHQVIPYERFFDRLDSMMLKHVPKIYKFYKSLNIKNFGLAPSSYDPLKQRTFSSWHWRKIDSGLFY